MNATLAVSPGDVAHRPAETSARVDPGQRPPAPAEIVEQYDPPSAVADLAAEVQAEPSPPPADPPPAPIVRRPTPVWVHGDCDPRSIVPEPEPLPGTIDATIISLGHKTTVRLWSPEAWAALTDQERAIAKPAPGREPGWWLDMYQHEQTENQKARELEFYRKHGYVQDEAGRWGKPKPPEPQDDPAVLDRYREARRGVVIRAIRRWEVARRAMAAVYDMPLLEVVANRHISNVAANEVERDCRQLEASLGDAIMRYAANEPHAGSPYPSCDETRRTRPAAVRYRGMTYVCVLDPTDQLNDDDPESCSTPPIVVRLEADRLVDLDDIRA